MAAQGLRVFPLRPRDKRPVQFSAGFPMATTDLDTVVGWWTGKLPLPPRERKAGDPDRLPKAFAGPACNIGIATGAGSGFFVLDLDGEAGLDALLSLAQRHGKLPVTPRQSTGKGGHLLFAWPEGQGVSNSASRIAPGVDVRGEGGYIVAAPSIHPSGRAYAWQPGGSPFDMPFARAPAWLLRLAAPPVTQPPRPSSAAPRLMRAEGVSDYALGALQSAAEEIRRSPAGAHNVTLHRNAYGIGRLVGAGELSRDMARGQLVAAGLQLTHGKSGRPWTLSEVEAAIEHAMKRGEASPRTAPTPPRRAS